MAGKPEPGAQKPAAIYLISRRYFLAALESAYQTDVRRNAPDADMKVKKPTSAKSGLELRKNTARVERERKKMERSAEMKMCFLLPSM